MVDEFASSFRRQTKFWFAAMAVFLLFMWLFSDILLPFIAAMVLAYFLDPVADKLESWNISRTLGSLLILVGFLLIFIIALMVVIPILGNQVAAFIKALPGYVAKLHALIASTQGEWLKKFVGIDSTALQDNMGQIMQQGARWLSTIVGKLWASGQSLVSILSLLIVTPVVAFYLLVDWDHMVERVDSWLPLDHRDTVRGIASDMNDAIAAFVRGQGTLCLVLGSYYGIALTLAGLNFGLLIGLFAGLISFIPYIGSTVGLTLSVGVAVVQFWPDYWWVTLIACIFFFGQFLEGYILQPKLVGNSVGLHPVWLMFALFAFGSLFGFTGMLIAVPASAAIAVLVRFALRQYLNSDVYRGKSVPHKAPEKVENEKKGQAPEKAPKKASQKVTGKTQNAQ